MRKFCVLRALLKRTILEKKFFFKKKHDFEENFFSKKHDFERKVYVKSVILNKTFSSCNILNQKFYVASDYISTFLQRVRF